MGISKLAPAAFAAAIAAAKSFAPVCQSGELAALDGGLAAEPA